MRKWLGLPPLPLRMRLALALALAAAAPLVLSTALFSGRQEAAVRAEALARQEGQALTLAAAVEDYVNLHRAAVAALAAQPGLLQAPAAVQREQLQLVTRAYPDIDSTALFDANGNQLRRSDDITTSVPVRGYPVYELARQTNQPSLDILQSPVFNRPVFAFGAPVRDAGGNFAGLVVAALPSTHMAEFLAEQNVGQLGRAYLIDGQGRAIAHPDAGLVAAFADLSAAPGVSTLLAGGRFSGTLTYTGPDGEQLAGYARVLSLGWTVVLERPAAVALAGLRGAQAGALGILLISLAATAAAGWLLSAIITRPVDELLAGIRGLAAEPEIGGDAAAAAGPPQREASRLPFTTVPELLELMAAFREMRTRLAIRTREREEEMHVRMQAEGSLRQAVAALSQHEEALRQANEELEAEVARRTEDLRCANSQLQEELGERRRAEAARQESEERYRRLVEWAPLGIMVHDGQTITYVNPAGAGILGAGEPGEIAGRPLLDFVHPAYQEITRAGIRQVLDRQAAVPLHEQEMLRLDGSPVAVASAAVPVNYGGVLAVQVVILDVSDRKRAEAERESLLRENREQRELLERLIDAAPVGIAVVRGPRHCYELANPAYQALAGLPPGAITGRAYAEVWAGAAGPVIERLDRVYATGETVSLRASPAALGPGRAETYWDVDDVPLRGPDGVVDGVLILASEVTAQVLARRQIEEARAQAQELADEREAILASMTEGLIIGDREGRILHMNPEALRIHGLPEISDALRHASTYGDLFEIGNLDGTPLPPAEWPITRALRGETFTHAEVRLRRRDTGATWIGSFGGTPVAGTAGGTAFAVLTLRDITAQKQVEWERERLLERVQETARELAGREVSLRAARDELERRVQERTQELRTTAEGLAQANERLRMLYDIDQAILAARSPAEIAQAALERIGQVMPCDRASILMIERGTGQVRMLATAGIPLPGFDADNLFPLDEWVVSDDLRRGALHVTNDLTHDGDPPALTAALLQAGLCQRIQAPLIAAGQLIGSLNLLSCQAGALPASALEIAAQVALSLAVAIENARLNEQVRASRSEFQALNRRMLEIQENERRAIARELHDEAGQALATLMIGLGLIEREAGRPAAVLERVAELKQTTDTVLGDLHDLAVDLRPASLDRLGLLPSLQQYVATYRRQTGLDAVLESVGIAIGERFPPEVETTIYRVVQEALTNVARHANATYAGILIERRGPALVAIVEDDGIGMEPGHAQERERLGLLGMRERAEMVGGTLTIESAPGAGTTVFIEVPVG